MDPVKVGVIGIGRIAQVAHIPVLKKAQNAELFAVCDVDKGKARWIADKYNIPHVFSDIENMLKLDGLDAVHVCTPNNLHMPVTIAALSSGLHVLIEKPMALNPLEAQRMVDASKQYDRKLMVAMNHRFRPDAMALKDFISAGEFGKVNYVKTGWLRQKGEWVNKSWLTHKRVAGGGVLMDIGIQMLDLGLWLMGNPEPVSVTACSYNFALQDNGVEDSVATMIRLDNGATLTVEVSWSLILEKDFTYLNAYGIRGSAMLNPLRMFKEMHGNLVNVTPTDKPSKIKDLFKHSYQIEIDHFIKHIRGEADALSSAEEGVRRLRIIEGIYQSAELGKEVRFDEN